MGFQQGLSGLNASSKSLETIGHNIANANTYGAKSSRAEFADMYAGAIAGGHSIGTGVTLATVAQQFTQGGISATGNPLDLAIDGAGFFQVTGKNGETAYSRNGAFKIDREGFVQNNQGQRLVGFPADATGAIIPGYTAPLQMPTAGMTPKVTTTMKMALNLNATEAVKAPGGSGPQIDFADPKTYNSATSASVYDAKGQDIALTYYFQKTAPDTWDVYVAANGEPVSMAGGNPTPTTTLRFGSDGRTPIAPTGPVTLNIPAVTSANGAVSVPVSGIQLDVAGTTQYGSKFGVSALEQNGYGASQLTHAQFEANGVFTAYYSNGQSRAVGQVAIANFSNPQGLTPTGGNGWVQSFASGDPIVGVPGEGNLGSPQAGALEESNVDLTAQLVDMITAQRFYQANSQTIKTQDQILQTIVNLR